MVFSEYNGFRGIMATEYKLSGNQGNTWTVGLLLSLSLSGILSFIYTKLLLFNPLIYLNFFVWGLYLFVVVQLIAFIAKTAKSRNPSSMLVLGILIALFTQYFGWLFFLHDFPLEATHSYSALLMSPPLFLKTMSDVAAQGHPSFFGLTIKGGLMWGVWALEAIGVLAAGYIGGKKALHEKVFCEHCQLWAEDLSYDMRLEPKDKESLKKAIEGDVDQLFSFSIADEDAVKQVRLNLQACPECDNTSTLDFDLIARAEDVKNEVLEDYNDASPVFLLSAQQLKRFRDMDFAKSENQ